MSREESSILGSMVETNSSENSLEGNGTMGAADEAEHPD